MAGIKRTHDEYVSEVSVINPDIQVIGIYTNVHTKILHKCKIDGYEWSPTPKQILQGSGCPVCSRPPRVIGPAPEYKNSIWESEYKEYFSLYLTEEQMKTIMPRSNKKIEVLCPHCKKNKFISPDNMIHDGFNCVCDDGRSYPNKFMYGLLNQTSIKYVQEKTFVWSCGRAYDIYIPSLNCIIENHGAQHYDGCFGKMGGRTLENEMQNDLYKKSLAKDNAINNYYEIDCRRSELQYIKTSILNSGLLNLLGVFEKDIDWTKCAAFAASNLVKEASELYNDGYTIIQISEILKISNNCARNYVHKGTEVGWCRYNANRDLGRKGINQGKSNPNATQIIRLKDGKIYDTSKEARLDNGICKSVMTKRCNEHKDFMRYDEWLNKLNNTKLKE